MLTSESKKAAMKSFDVLYLCHLILKDIEELAITAFGRALRSEGSFGLLNP